MDSFFAKGFKASKCKTLLKLTIPRIKLLRNRREIHLKQMRRDIAKLLETGQEATARIRVEHIIREEKMMAAQEIVELFAELISVRLPIIEAQRECPLDLKEAISSVCFAAPRCADLPELQQVHMLFAAKYGKEFVSAATELMPDCGVNRQLIELLSVRAPDPEVKLKLLKDIAEEHDLDWDPTASESELLKPHEDLLNGPTQFTSGSKLPLPEEKHVESTFIASKQSTNEQSDSDDSLETMDFPEVPRASVRPNIGTVSSPEMLPFPEVEFESTIGDDSNDNLTHENEIVAPHKGLEEISPTAKESDLTKSPGDANKQYLPFISPPLSSVTFPEREIESPQPQARTKSGLDVDLQDVLAAAQAAAESAERAAGAARSAATLAQVRISELIKKRSDDIIADSSSGNPFHLDISEAYKVDKPRISRSDSSRETNVGITSVPDPDQDHKAYSTQMNDHKGEFISSFPSYDDNKVDFDSPLQLENDLPELQPVSHQPQRLPSMDDDYLSYPNLFKRQDSNIESIAHYLGDSSRSSN